MPTCPICRNYFQTTGFTCCSKHCSRRLQQAQIPQWQSQQLQLQQQQLQMQMHLNNQQQNNLIIAQQHQRQQQRLNNAGFGGVGFVVSPSPFATWATPSQRNVCCGHCASFVQSGNFCCGKIRF